MSHTLRVEVSNSHNPAATPVNGQYPVAFIRKQLSVDEVYPADQRYNSGTGQVQFTPDGGASWEDAPTLDPRNQTNRPPQTGAGADCNSAASAVEWLKRYIALVTGILTAGGTLIEGISAIVGFLGVVGGYGILWEIISGIFGTLQTYGATLINAAMTSAVYDELECIIYCNLNASNQVDEARFNNILSKVDTTIGSTAGVIIHGLLALMGWGGLNNVMAMALATGSCGGCGCDWCYTWDFTVSSGGWLAGPGGNNSIWSVGVGWTGGPVGGDKSDVSIYFDVPAGATITSFEGVYTKTAGSGADNVNHMRIQNPIGTQVGANDTNTLGSGLPKVLTYSGVVKRFTWDINSGTAVTTCVIRRITIKGTGTNPFGTTNC